MVAVIGSKWKSSSLIRIPRDERSGAQVTKQLFRLCTSSHCERLSLGQGNLFNLQELRRKSFSAAAATRRLFSAWCTRKKMNTRETSFARENRAPLPLIVIKKRPSALFNSRSRRILVFRNLSLKEV